MSRRYGANHAVLEEGWYTLAHLKLDIALWSKGRVGRHSNT